MAIGDGDLVVVSILPILHNLGIVSVRIIVGQATTVYCIFVAGAESWNLDQLLLLNVSIYYNFDFILDYLVEYLIVIVIVIRNGTVCIEEDWSDYEL